MAADRTRNDARWRYFEIGTNHMIPFNRPKEFVDILLEVSGTTVAAAVS